LNRSKFSFNLSLEVRFKPVQFNPGNFSVSGGELKSCRNPVKPDAGMLLKLFCGTQFL